MMTKRKGVTIRLFGAILIILGSLDMMLTWRGGITAEPFHIALLIGGFFLFGVGAAIGASRRHPDGGERI